MSDGGAFAIEDASQRREAIDIARSFIVQAPAGSGKTELLTQRMLALLGRVECPEEMLAITFTRKAAAEMRTRLLQSLEVGEGPEPSAPHARQSWLLARSALQRDRQKGWNLLENPSRLNLQTIDSFCSMLVRRMPWVSRFGALPRIAENASLLYRRAADRTLARIEETGGGGDEIALLLSHLDNRMGLLRDLLVDMLQSRDQWLRHVTGIDHEQQRRRMEAALGRLVADTLQGADETLPAGCRETLLSLGRFAAANLRDKGPRPLLDLLDADQFPAAEVQGLARWQGLADLLLTSEGKLRRRVDVRCGFPAAKEARARAMKQAMEETLGRFCPEAAAQWQAVRELPRAVYPDHQWKILQALVDLLPLAVAELWLVFREEGEVDFAEIALKAIEALGGAEEPSELLLQLDAGIGHILVDEFQDTSFLQFRLLEQLTSGWEPGDGRTLFLVGDPMQSIYRFREAEVGLFLKAAREGLGTVPLTPLVLSSNFRSQKGIVDWVNDAFVAVLPAHQDIDLGAVSYATATAVHPRLPEPAVTIHPFTNAQRTQEAQRAVELVMQCLDRHPEQTIGLLVRSRTHLPEILHLLRAEGVSYQAQDIDRLDDRPAARDAVSLTRALVHPGDRLAWLAVLRAPWCGLELGDLLALCAEAPHRTLPELLDRRAGAPELSEGGRRRLARVVPVLREALGQKGRMTLRRLVEGCWLALGGAACCGAGGLEDVQRVFDLLEKLDHGGDLRSHEAFDEGLSQLFAAPDAEADGRVQIMTIHKAKGLEFDTVILPGLGRQPARPDSPLLRWLEHPEWGLLLAPMAPRARQVRDPIYEAIGRLDRAKEQFEAGRLLYVAATRARLRLHLLGEARINAGSEAVPASGSLLEKLWPVLAREFASLKSLDVHDADREERVQRPILRLPSGWRPPEFRPAPVLSATPARQPSELAEQPESSRHLPDWQREVARHVGTLVHGELENLALMDGEGRKGYRPAAQRQRFRRTLAFFGVAGSRLEGAVEKVVQALDNTLASPRGRWLLDAWPEAASEMPLAGMVEGDLVHAVIDRTFVDEQGVRWIVDFKTSDDLQGDRAAFLADEARRYQPQLRLYAALFRALEPQRPIRTALYFPSFDGWREVDWQGGGAIPGP